MSTVISLKKGKKHQDSKEDYFGSFDTVFLKCFFCGVEVNRMGTVMNEADEIHKGAMILDTPRCAKRHHPIFKEHAFLPDNWGIK